jgi:chromosome segregation ATPase
MDTGPDLRSQAVKRTEQLEEKIGKLVERVDKLEEQVGDLENDVADLEAQIESREWLRLAFRALVADLDHALGIKFMPISVRLQIEELGATL